MNYIAFDREKCIYCELCSGVCSLNKLEQIKPSAACIRIARDTAQSFGPLSCSVCDMSHDRACVEACPADALSYDDEAGVVRFDAEACTMCESCIDACPNVGIDRDSQRIMICDLCGGDPLCVAWCPEGALTWEGRS